MTVNVKKCAVVVCNEDDENPVALKRKWAKDELSIVDQYTYLGVDISKYCAWDAHIKKVLGKVKVRVAKMNAIPTDSHLLIDNRLSLIHI